MATGIRVTPEQLQQISAQLDAGASSIEGTLRQLAGNVAPLGSDWAGVAQARFLELWAEWQRSGATLHQALTGIARLTPAPAPATSRPSTASPPASAVPDVDPEHPARDAHTHGGICVRNNQLNIAGRIYRDRVLRGTREFSAELVTVEHMFDDRAHGMAKSSAPMVGTGTPARRPPTSRQPASRSGRRRRPGLVAAPAAVRSGSGGQTARS